MFLVRVGLLKVVRCWRATQQIKFQTILFGASSIDSPVTDAEERTEPMLPTSQASAIDTSESSDIAPSDASGSSLSDSV